MAALKRRKAYEAQCEKINGAMTTIETQVMTLENANVSMQAIGAMQEGAKAMKGIHKEMYFPLFPKKKPFSRGDF